MLSNNICVPLSGVSTLTSSSAKLTSYFSNPKWLRSVERSTEERERRYIMRGEREIIIMMMVHWSQYL